MHRDDDDDDDMHMMMMIYAPCNNRIPAAYAYLLYMLALQCPYY